jgi:GT2 family glycosyltransferase
MSMHGEYMPVATIGNNPKVTILLLNYNGWEDAIVCLESVYKITYPNWAVILVDNGSVDGSVSKIKEWAAGKIQVESKFFEYDAGGKPIEYIEEIFYDEKGLVKVSKKEEEWVTLPPHQKLSILRIEKNRGFTGGNNIGMEYILRESKTDYILLLSNDTIVDPNFLNELVRVAKRDEKVGMVATKLLFYNNSNIINSVGTLIFKDGSAAHLGGKEIDSGQYNQVIETFAPCAAAALYRSEMLKEIGLFDRDFFAYLEDVDLGWRARLNGWKCVLAPKAIVYHKHSTSTGKYSRFKVYQIERNRILVLIKNYPWRYILLSPFFTFYRYLGMFLIRKNNRTEVAKYSENVGMWMIFLVLLNAWFRAFCLFPKLIAKRKTVQSLKNVQNQDIGQWFIEFSEKFSIVLEK